MKPSKHFVAMILFYAFSMQAASAAILAAPIREAGEQIFAKFFSKSGKRTVGEVTERTAQAVAKHGDEAMSLLKATGPVGFNALEQAGPKAAEVIKLYRRRGNEAIWVISENKRLAIFLKHGDSAADALIKHPGLAESLVGRFGSEAAGALNSLSRQGAVRLEKLSNEGVLTASSRSAEMLPVVGKYGDAAMDFIWRNKGALTATAVLGSFFNDPKAYIQGVKELVVDPIARPIVGSINWTLIISIVLLVIFFPFLTRSIIKARLAMRSQS